MKSFRSFIKEDDFSPPLGPMDTDDLPNPKKKNKEDILDEDETETPQEMFKDRLKALSSGDKSQSVVDTTTKEEKPKTEWPATLGIRG